MPTRHSSDVCIAGGRDVVICQSEFCVQEEAKRLPCLLFIGPSDIYYTNSLMLLGRLAI